MRYKKNIIRYNLTLIFLSISFLLFSQNRNLLEEERMRIIDKIEFTSKILKKTEKDKTSTLDFLNSLQNQIRNRNSILKNLKAQTYGINQSITQKQSEYDLLIQKRKNIKGNFAKILRNNYIQSITKNKFLFLLSSTDWENFVDRKRYIKQYNKYAKKRLVEIKLQENTIDSLLDQINIDKSKIDELIVEEKNNIDKLKEESKKKDEILNRLKKNERKLLLSLKKQKKQREKFNKSIEDIIINQLTSGKSNLDIKETKIVSKSFKENISKFNWPVNGGYISSHYGKHKHPTIRGVYTFNKGVDIRTNSNSSVKAVFEGEVVGLLHISGFNWMMIIKHGKYYTVYSKMESVDVSKGDKVQKDQILGRIGENGQFHFELWKEKTKLNPEKWFKY